MNIKEIKKKLKKGKTYQFNCIDNTSDIGEVLFIEPSCVHVKTSQGNIKLDFWGINQVYEVNQVDVQGRLSLGV